MSFFKISLAGDLCSGKSTVGAIIKEKFNLEVISIGKIQRDMAQKYNMTTLEFNNYMESHPEIDKILDDTLCSYENKQGNYLFDSRMAWHFVPSAFSVYLKVNIEESAKRVLSAKRSDETYSSLEDAIEKLTLRRKSEQLRYKTFYNVDIMNMDNYDLVIDTTSTTAEEVAQMIEDAYLKKFGNLK